MLALAALFCCCLFVVDWFWGRDFKASFFLLFFCTVGTTSFVVVVVTTIEQKKREKEREREKIYLFLAVEACKQRQNEVKTNNSSNKKRQMIEQTWLLERRNENTGRIPNRFHPCRFAYLPQVAHRMDGTQRKTIQCWKKGNHWELKWSTGQLMEAIGISTHRQTDTMYYRRRHHHLHNHLLICICWCVSVCVCIQNNLQTLKNTLFLLTDVCEEEGKGVPRLQLSLKTNQTVWKTL